VKDHPQNQNIESKFEPVALLEKGAQGHSSTELFPSIIDRETSEGWARHF
jgi:hypothetical protein